VLNGISSYDYSGGSVSSAGDVNGDDFDDILIGAILGGNNAGHRPGETYVVFGKGTEFDETIDLADLNGSDGFVLKGISGYDYNGGSVSSAGDVNDDGVDDILIGANGADANGFRDAGNTYVVFGKKTDNDADFAKAINLADLNGRDGFVLNGISTSDQAGRSVSSAGDINGDGIDDILIGSSNADVNGITSAGNTYLVFGKNTDRDGDFAKAINLADLNGSDGFVFNGIGKYNQSGGSVSSAGDVNGDDVDDILIGAGNIGETYVVFGGATLLADFDAADGASDGSIDLSSILAFI
jgi:hypothetical protein